MPIITKICFLLLILALTIFAQDKSKIINKLADRNVITSQVEPGILKLTYPNGKIIYKNINEFSLQKSASQIPTTTIDLRTIDTSLYSDEYSFWQDVVISQGAFETVIIDDINNNKLPELYGFQKYYETDFFPVVILEMDSFQKFKLAYSYPDTTKRIKTIFDIDNDNKKEAFIYSFDNNLVAYEQTNEDSLPTEYLFNFNKYSFTQIEKPVLGDFDNNGKNDIVFYLMPNTLKMVIAEYDSISNNFLEIYDFIYPDRFAAGFAVNDFDDDGKTDFVMGSINGEIYIVENTGIKNYAHVWTGSVETNNAYLFFHTNDIDQNGKEEFWVGGDSFFNGMPITRFTAFEYTNDNDYAAVYRIDLIGVFSLFAGNTFAKDFNNDGTEELFICIDQHVIILEFTGKKLYHDYNIYYLKRNELADSNSVYYGATVYDLTNDGVDEILISNGIANQMQQRKDYTVIYKFNNSTNISAPILDKYELQISSYPNPFNVSAIIEFIIPNSSFCTLKLYDILGNEIRTLLSEELSAGKHNINLITPELSSGIYYLQLQADEYIKTTKAVLLK